VSGTRDDPAHAPGSGKQRFLSYPQAIRTGAFELHLMAGYFIALGGFNLRYEVRAERTSNVFKLSAFQAYYVVVKFRVPVVSGGVFPELELPDFPRLFENV
jgi:hypothetical protein